MSNKDIKAFIRNIEILIPVNDANSKRFIRDIESSITEYAYIMQAAPLMISFRNLAHPETSPWTTLSLLILIT